MNLYSLKIVLAYIFETEMDDFAENPSENHVYYHAVMLESGKQEADDVLEEALANLKRGEK